MTILDEIPGRALAGCPGRPFYRNMFAGYATFRTSKIYEMPGSDFMAGTPSGYSENAVRGVAVEPGKQPGVRLPAGLGDED